MRIRAFRGIRSREGQDPGRLAAPPYDQIDPARRDVFHQTPYHFTHLSCPVDLAGGDPYAFAARLHRDWHDTGAIAEDAEDGLYVLDIELPDGSHRLGLTALLGLEAPDSRTIQPHEDTLDKAIDDRLRLLRAMRIDLEPILVLADEAEGRLDTLLAADTRTPVLATHRDEFGNVHRLHALRDPARIEEYRALMAPLRGLIADGHHRYRVASLYAAEIGAAADAISAHKLAVITSLRSPALSIDPIHRGLASEFDLTPAAAWARERQTLPGADGPALAAAVARAPQPALGLWTAGRDPEVWRLDDDALRSRLSPARAALAVAALHLAVLPEFGLTATAATDGTVRYASDAAALGGLLASGAWQSAWVLPPMSPPDFAAAIAEGGLLPPKSTRFLPKLVSGLVWAGQD